MLSRGTILILISAVSFGVMPIFARLADSEGVGVKTLLLLRFAIAAAVMWAIWASRRRSVTERATNVKALLGLVVLGGIGYVGQSFAYFTALTLIPASTTSLLLFTYPALVTLLAWAIFREKLRPIQLVALLPALSGTLLVLGMLSTALGTTSEFLANLNPEGVFWGVAAAVIYSVYIIAGSRLTRAISPIFSSAVVMSAAAVVYLIWGAATGDLKFSFTWLGLFWVLAIAVICTVVAITTFFSGLGLIGPSRAAIISTIEPVTTIALAMVVLNESLTGERVLGGVMVVGALLLLEARPRK